MRKLVLQNNDTVIVHQCQGLSIGAKLFPPWKDDEINEVVARLEEKGCKVEQILISEKHVI